MHLVKSEDCFTDLLLVLLEARSERLFRSWKSVRLVFVKVFHSSVGAADGQFHAECADIDASLTFLGCGCMGDSRLDVLAFSDNESDGVTLATTVLPYQNDLSQSPRLDLPGKSSRADTVNERRSSFDVSALKLR
ncbi:hypothetical protein SRHO_G00273670 [Serrasalmus rhombeus]